MSALTYTKTQILKLTNSENFIRVFPIIQQSSMLRLKVITRVTSTQTRSKSTVLLKFFTKAHCMLCTNANEILQQAISSPDVENVKLNFTKVDIMDPNNKEWFDKYCYDVPVLHIELPNDNVVKKHMHYFDKSQLIKDFLTLDTKEERL